MASLTFLQLLSSQPHESAMMAAARYILFVSVEVELQVIDRCHHSEHQSATAEPMKITSACLRVCFAVLLSIKASNDWNICCHIYAFINMLLLLIYFKNWILDRMQRFVSSGHWRYCSYSLSLAVLSCTKISNSIITWVDWKTTIPLFTRTRNKLNDVSFQPDRIGSEPCI